MKGNSNPENTCTVAYRWCVVIVNALFLVFLTGIGAGLRYGWGDEGAVMKKFEVVRQISGKTETSSLSDKFFALNVGNDRELVTAFDEYGLPAGNRAIVNRRSLANFLDSVEGANYKCIIVDIQFFKSDETDADSALFAALNRLPRIVAVANDDDDAVDAINPARLAPAEYGITIDENNFVKYKYDDGIRPGIALAAYNAAEGRSLRLSGWFPVDSGRLASGSLYLTMPYRIESSYDSVGNKLIYNLGVDILDVYSSQDLADLVKDKIIVIGDYAGGDDHDTYAGTVHGPVIIMNAIIALYECRHVINWWCMAVMFIVYMFVVWMIVYKSAGWLPRGFGRSRILRFIALFTGYTSTIFFMNLAFYFITGVIYDLYLPALYITVLYFIVQHNLIRRARLFVERLITRKSNKLQ